MTDEETPPVVRPVFRFRDTVAIKLGEADPAAESSTPAPAPVAVQKRRRGLIARASEQEWSASALLLFLDIFCWLLIYGFTGLVRGDAYYASPFVFFVVDLLQG